MKAATDALSRSGRSIGDALRLWTRAVGVDGDEPSDLTIRVDSILVTVGVNSNRS